MRIHELVIESQKIDELSLAGVGKGIGKAANVAGKAVGGAVGGTVAAAKQFSQGVKQGYQGANTAVGGAAPAATAPTGTAPTATTPATTTPATTTPATATATPAATAPTGTASSPAGASQGKVGVPVGRQAIDQAVATVKSVRGDRRPQVVAYGMQQLGAIKESKVGIQSNFLGIEI